MTVIAKRALADRLSDRLITHGKGGCGLVSVMGRKGRGEGGAAEALPARCRRAATFGAALRRQEL